jgi:hypothetical protein
MIPDNTLHKNLAESAGGPGSNKIQGNKKKERRGKRDRSKKNVSKQTRKRRDRQEGENLTMNGWINMRQKTRLG